MDERTLFCESDCPMLKRIEDLENDSKRNQETHKEFFKEFEKIRLEHAMVSKDVASMIQKINEMYLDIKDMKNVPTKRYEQIVSCILTAIIGGLIGYFLK